MAALTDFVANITEDEFYEKYKPIPNPRDGSDFWDDARLVGASKANHVWSCVDGDDGNTVVLAGYHFVNRFAFMITEVPWANQFIEVLFDDYDFDDDHD